MISILGTIKGVTLKSKVGDDNRTYHHLGLNLELTEGVERIDDIVRLLKSIVCIDIDSRQPTLGMPEQQTVDLGVRDILDSD